MKPIVYFMIACLLVFSSIPGNWNAAQAMSIKDCCQGVSCNQGKHQKRDKGCDSKACNRMVTCNSCGFIFTERLSVQHQFAKEINKPTPLNVMGIVTGYPQAGWHPPKV